VTNAERAPGTILLADGPVSSLDAYLEGGGGAIYEHRSFHGESRGARRPVRGLPPKKGSKKSGLHPRAVRKSRVHPR
jgi:hypothetical protein